MKLNAWIETLPPADKARLAEELNRDPAAALRAYEAYAGAEALKVLRELYDLHHLGDMIYTIRDCEGGGWDGPKVTRWAAATARAEALIKEVE
jgi:hypothetical protein